MTLGVGAGNGDATPHPTKGTIDMLASCGVHQRLPYRGPEKNVIVHVLFYLLFFFAGNTRAFKELGAHV